MKHEDDFVQALMVQIVYRAATVASNSGTPWWPPSDTCSEWQDLPPIQLGGFVVTNEGDFDRWATISCAGKSVTTELGSKRIFMYGRRNTGEPATIQEWCEWFDAVMVELNRIDDEAIRKIRGR